GLQQALARARVELGGAARLREAAEEIGFVRKVRAEGDQRLRPPRRIVRQAVGADRAGADTELRQAIGARRLHQRARLRETRARYLNIRVVAVGALDQVVEHRVGE